MDVNDLLPFDGYRLGMTLTEYPSVLKDKDGNVVKDWPYGYTPSLTELQEVIELFKRQNWG